MVLFPWCDEYSVGVQKVDSEHKILINLINELHDANEQGKGREALGKILNDLLVYTQTHFSEEEQLMRSVKYPNYEVHKTIHDKFTEQIFEYQQKFFYGDTTLSQDLLEFLKDWLIKHIQGVDKQYTAHFHKKGIR